MSAVVDPPGCRRSRPCDLAFCVPTPIPRLGSNGVNDENGTARTNDKRWAAIPVSASPKCRGGAAPPDPSGAARPNDMSAAAFDPVGRWRNQPCDLAPCVSTPPPKLGRNGVNDESGAGRPNDKRGAALPAPSVPASPKYKGGPAPPEPSGAARPNDVSGAAPPAHVVPLPRCMLLAQLHLKEVGGDPEACDDGQTCVEECALADAASEADAQGLAIQDAHQETDKEQKIEYQSTDPPVIPPPLSVHPKTMMVRQASRRITQEGFLSFWPQKGHGYDLLYAVVDLKKKRGTGRVFINFENYEGAAGFRNEFDGLVDPEMSSKDENDAFKPLIVEPAEKQGFQAQVAHWECHLRRDVDAEFTPAIFIRGERRNFWQHAHSLEMATRHQDSETGLVFL